MSSSKLRTAKDATRNMQVFCMATNPVRNTNLFPLSGQANWKSLIGDRRAHGPPAWPEFEILGVQERGWQ
jgi:hypothetical protein